ncbi:hypothetical protein HanXRQr2_Chr15g0699581 [Helianthus annuus]|uniref:Uncharacterized protein n=1 Tax=Helianthus annuus TaxID=4232 RepID=A0A9K3E160_HELAN|nr:hypothetical protein HanXRQr2_Chr15g0699581 [Helianthus annuus]KAJ0456289.1 hypothetical protein HanIR_Chr15g0760711 [Helianthus annuus]KAJ0831796.1 hypothetical protein HanPSC8_Chr15g0671281 [Helianthus annuus]
MVGNILLDHIFLLRVFFTCPELPRISSNHLHKNPPPLQMKTERELKRQKSDREGVRHVSFHPRVKKPKPFTKYAFRIHIPEKRT